MKIMLTFQQRITLFNLYMKYGYKWDKIIFGYLYAWKQVAIKFWLIFFPEVIEFGELR